MTEEMKDVTVPKFPFKKSEHVPVIKCILCTDVIRTYIDGKQYFGIFSGFNNEAMFHAAYPVIIEPGDKNRTTINANPVGLGAKYILGVSNPKYVFSVLEEAFKVCFPEEDPKKWMFWEIVQFNQSVYGQQPSNKAPKIDSVTLEKLYYREIAGDKTRHSTIWLNEATFKRFNSSVPMSTVFRDKILRNKEQINLGKTVSSIRETTFPENYIHDVSDIIAKHKAERTNSEDKKMFSIAPDVLKRAIHEAEEKTKEDEDNYMSIV